MSTTTTDPALTARYQAIESSGWGHEPKLFQPRNFTFWVMAFLFVAGGFNLYLSFAPGLDAYTTSITQGVVWFTVYGLVIAWIIDRLDRYSPIPGKIRLVAFLWGGVVGTFALAVHYNDAIFSILAKTQGGSFRNDWGPGFAAPISEEVAKGLAVVILIGVAPRVIRTATDGLIVGAFSGLGFQVFEDVLYVVQSTAAGFGQSEAGLATAQQRTVLGFTGHWMWSGIFGAGIVYLLGRPMQPARRGLGIGLMVLPIVGHFLWNATTPIAGDPPFAALLAIMLAFSVVIAVIFVAVYRMTVPVEQQQMRDVLEPEVRAGVISGEELDALVSRRKPRKELIDSAGDRDEKRRREHVLEATRDLADEIAAARGADTDDVEHARAEIARVRA